MRQRRAASVAAPASWLTMLARTRPCRCAALRAALYVANVGLRTANQLSQAAADVPQASCSRMNQGAAVLLQVTPDDASDANTRGEAVQDFVSSPQVGHSPRP